MNLSTDHEVMLAVREGDIAKLGILFEQYHKPLYNFFYKHTMNIAASEDLVQDVFLKILKYRHTYRGDSKFTTWMFQIARNARIDYFRKYQQHEDQLEENEQLLNQEPDPENVTQKKSDIEILQRALRKLSAEKREVIILSRFQHLRYEEISNIQGCKVGTVKARVFRALKELTKIYLDLTGEKKT